MVLPDLIIAGAPKSGTSSLHFWLDAHPEAKGSRVKDSCFLGDEILRFNKGLSYIEDGLEGYEKLLGKKGGVKILFESTSTYIYYSTPLQVIPEMASEPKVIFILREPAARLYSKFKFNSYKLKNFKGSFREYTSLNGSFPSGQHFEEGWYINYLERWQKALGTERIGVFIFEKMLADRKSFMKDVCTFLDLDPTFYNNYDFFQRNETVALKSVGLHRLGLKLQPFIPVKVQEALIPLYLKLNSGKARGRTHEEKDLVEELKDLYRPYNQRLAEAFPGLDLKGWHL